MTLKEKLELAGAAIVFLLAWIGGPPAFRRFTRWIADRREKREALEEQRERHRHEEAVLEIRADEQTGKHAITTITGLANVVHVQSTEVLMLRADVRKCHEEREKERTDCDERIAAIEGRTAKIEAVPAVRKSLSSPGFRPPSPGGEEE